MIWMTALSSGVFLLLTAVTFVIWLVPPRPGSKMADFYPMLAALTGTLFFLACFALGVWFSVLRLRGEFWKL